MIESVFYYCQRLIMIVNVALAIRKYFLIYLSHLTQLEDCREFYMCFDSITISTCQLSSWIILNCFCKRSFICTFYDVNVMSIAFY